ncbi:MAG: heterodisulfide reductase-related iron-sulfur binding cluster [Vicinamibacterales bacterium]
MIEIWVFRFLVVAFAGFFLAQMLTRLRLVLAARNNLSAADVPRRLRRVFSEVVLQSQVVSERPWVGVAHAFVFWGFVAFAFYTLAQFLRGLGIVDVTGTTWFRFYARLVVPFAIAVLAGILFLLVRRVFFRPAALGQSVSGESVVIALFIAALMATFLLEFVLEGTAERLNWWIHSLIILVFLTLIPDSKHLHLLLSPVTIFLEAPDLGTVPNLDFDKEEIGYETVKDLERKQVIDALTCVECGRCQDNCPAHATGKLLNPKRLILQNEEALLAGQRDRRLAELYDPRVLWQCTTCGACEKQCPVGIEHLPLIVNARRGVVSNGDAPDYLGPVYNNLERRGNIWGLTYDQRQKFVESAGLEKFDPTRHRYLVWLGCAGAFEADFQKSLRALFSVLRRTGVSFGVLEKERCTGDPAKRTGNEYLFQELAGQNVEELRSAGVKRIITSCPHCLKTLGGDYRGFGFEAEVVHSAVLVSSLTAGMKLQVREKVTYHDPCYLSRYAGRVNEPRDLLTRFGADVRDPIRARANPFCCGAGGGLLFEEHEEGKRISQERLEQLAATGAPTVVTACPFCSIMLKGAQASAGSPTEFIDLMTFVDRRMEGSQ